MLKQIVYLEILSLKLMITVITTIILKRLIYQVYKKSKDIVLENKYLKENDIIQIIEK